MPDSHAAYSREWALALSDALAELGETHTIVVGVMDGWIIPR